MCIGNVFAGMGIGIFKLAGLGTDPFSGMNMAVADMIGMAYGNFQLIVNIVLLIIEIAFGRRFLGIGTVVNAVCLAYITTFFYNIYTGVFGLELVAACQGTFGGTVCGCCDLLSGTVDVSDAG